MASPPDQTIETCSFPPSSQHISGSGITSTFSQTSAPESRERSTVLGTTDADLHLSSGAQLLGLSSPSSCAFALSRHGFDAATLSTSSPSTSLVSSPSLLIPLLLRSSTDVSGEIIDDVGTPLPGPSIAVVENPFSGAVHSVLGDDVTQASFSPSSFEASSTSTGWTDSVDSSLSTSLNSISGTQVRWHCAFDCGRTYRKSSGRSIRRHFLSCFRQHSPGSELLSEVDLNQLISSQQDAGKIVTGLRRWRMRHSRRAADDLSDSERWTCPFDCGKHYRNTSSRSIQQHANGCAFRHDGGLGDADLKALQLKRNKPRQREVLEKELHLNGMDKVEAMGRVEEQMTQLDGSDDPGDATMSTSSCSQPGPAQWDFVPMVNVYGRHQRQDDVQHALSADLAPTFSSLQFSSRFSSSSNGVPTNDDGREELDPLLVSQRARQKQLVALQHLEMALLKHQQDAAWSMDHSSTTIEEMQREAVRHLQSLVFDLFSRHGPEHPVFRQRVLTPESIQLLLLDHQRNEQRNHTLQQVGGMELSATNNLRAPVTWDLTNEAYSQPFSSSPLAGALTSSPLRSYRMRRRKRRSFLSDGPPHPCNVNN